MSIASQTLPIELMNAGESGVVVDVSGRSDLVVRLEEMGLNAGVRIRMVRPGSPCILEVNQHRISIRFDESISVLVDVQS